MLNRFSTEAWLGFIFERQISVYGKGGERENYSIESKKKFFGRFGMDYTPMKIATSALGFH